MLREVNLSLLPRAKKNVAKVEGKERMKRRERMKEDGYFENLVHTIGVA